jgi:hypothetical protein
MTFADVAKSRGTDFTDEDYVARRWVIYLIDSFTASSYCLLFLFL